MFACKECRNYQKEHAASGSEDWIPGCRAVKEGIWIRRRITSGAWRSGEGGWNGTRGGNDAHAGEIFASGGREGGGALWSATMSEPRLDKDYSIFFFSFFFKSTL